MKKLLLSVLFIFFSFSNVVNARERDSVVNKNFINPPVNDECSGAISVPVNPSLEGVSFVSGTTVGATYSATVGSCVANQNDVWYSFVATSSIQFFKFYNVVYFAPSNQLSYQVFSGSDCGNLTSIVCGYGEENIVSNLVVGQTYKVRVYSSIQVVTFAFDFAIFTTDPLINDECNNSINIPVNQGTSTDLFLNTTDLGASNSENTGNCYNGTDTWYHFTAVSPVQIVRFFDLENNQIFKTFSLFTGENCSSLTPVTCISNGVLENLTVGTTYTIKLYKNTIQSPSQSSFKIQINTIEAPLNDDCENAITVLANPDLQKNFFVTGSTAGATPSNMDSTDRDVYYRFIATSTQHLIYFDNVINAIQFEILEENSNCANSTLLDSFQGISSNYVGIVYYNFIVGNAYVIRVKSSSEDLSAVFDLSIRTHELVPNGECVTAIDVPVNAIESCDLFATGITQAGFFGEPPYYNPSDVTWYHFVATSKTHAIQFEDLDGVFSNTNFALYDACDTNQSINYSYVQGLKGYYNNLIIGNEYKIRLTTQNYVAPVSGQVKVCITTTPQPLNDECANALPLQVNAVNQTEYFVNSSTFGATNSDVANTCNGSADDDVWFSFVATSKFHTITLSNLNPSATDLQLAVYQGEDCASMLLKKCGNTNSLPLNTLTIGQSYKIRVYTNSPSANEFASFSIAVSTNTLALNDECSNAILVPTSTISNLNVIAASVKGGTQSSEENSCVPEADDDVWYEFIATETRHTINFNWTSQHTFFVNFAVYTGDCDNLTQVFCSTVGMNTLNDLIIGQTYKIRIWSSGSIPSNAIYKLIITNQDEPLVGTTSQFTPQELIADILIDDPCIAVSNVTSSTGTDFGSVNGIGYFTNSNPLFPISSGIILSTGNAANAGGPNPYTSSEGNSLEWANAGDVDLNATILAATGTPIVSKNTTKLEFDFTTQNDFMSFNFLFASEDYGADQCMPGDAFAFLLTDLTDGTTTNLAVVPGTLLPVSVSTIRDTQYGASCSSNNEVFFDTVYAETSNEGLGLFSPINFNGQTVLMTASASIVPNNPYHIKLVIADRGSYWYDSAVFIQAGSFTSGQSQCLDRIEMVSFIDANNNGIKEDSEINFTNGSFVYQINDAVENIEVSSSNGLHTIFGVNALNSYDITYNIQSEFAAYYSGTTSFSNIIIPVGSGTQTLYFPITQIQGFSDLSVSIIPIEQPVAGSNYANKVVYQNLGNIAASGIINYTKDVSVTVSTAESGVVLTPTGFTYNFENLAPFETRSFIIQMNVPAGRQMNENTPLLSNISISSTGDANSSNNSFQISQGLVSDDYFIHKTESHGNLLDITTFTEESYLYYTIYFQNKATVSVNNIRIKDVLDAQLDEETIQTVSASHPYTMERKGNELTWNFDYVYLPSYLENSDLSSGYVTFKIKLKPGFEEGDIIPNFAEIYFDTNPPIITNTFNSTFDEQLAKPEFTSGNFVVYPNPSSGLVYINTQNTIENLKQITLYDVLGKTILSSKNLSSRQSTIDVSSLAKGIYMIEITTENNFKQTKKLVVN